MVGDSFNADYNYNNNIREPKPSEIPRMGYGSSFIAICRINTLPIFRPKYQKYPNDIASQQKKTAKSREKV